MTSAISHGDAPRLLDFFGLDYGFDADRPMIAQGLARHGQAALDNLYGKVAADAGIQPQ